MLIAKHPFVGARGSLCNCAGGRPKMLAALWRL